ncbi:MAG: hypothetical protein JSV22_08905, partial [Bacteroidales bacterium]
MSNQVYIILFNLVILLYSYGCGRPDNKDDVHINRKALVQRHIPTLSSADSLSPFTVGNGEFAFTVDITGLQTFPDFYENGIPLGT